jgi:glycolate oxidase
MRYQMEVDVMLDPETLADLQTAIGKDNVLVDPEDIFLYQYDASMDFATPDAIVLPGTGQEVADVVKLANRKNIPFTARGAGTNLSGGSVASQGGLVISTTRLSRIIELDIPNHRVVVEPGVFNLDVQKALAPHGYLYAPDPASQKVSTMGGNVGENAGGPHCLKYGVTTNHVLGLEVVLPDGEIVRFGGKALDTPGYDLVGLFVGSEGTLGIVTQLTLRIIRQPEAIKTMLVVFDSLESAGQAVSDVIAAGIIPATLEMMDNLIIRAVENSIQAGYPVEASAVLIVELDGLKDDQDRMADEVMQICYHAGAESVKVARTQEERDQLWTGRRGAFGAVGSVRPNYLVCDGTVPRTMLPTVLRQVAEIGVEHDVLIGNVFHAGDGNLHPLILFDARDAQETSRVERAALAILQACVDAGGTITGEHGVGLEKLAGMGLIFSEADLQAMTWVKEGFDPAGLANPDKVLPAKSGEAA